MSQGFEIIRAKVKDNAAIVINRLMRSKQDEIVLVLPKNSIITADLNSLKILKEEAESIGKILSLNTDNDKIKSFAKTLGMLIYEPDNYKNVEKIEPIRQFRKIKMMTDVLPPVSIKSQGDDDIPEIPELQEELMKDSEEKEESNYQSFNPPISEPVIYEVTDKSLDLEKNLESFYGNGDESNILKSKNRFFLFSLNRVITFLAVSGLILFGIAMYLVLPKVNIIVSLKHAPLKTQIPVAVSKSASSLNLASSIIPGQYFSLSKTGSKTLEGSSNKIGGIIEIYNAYSATAQKLVAQTRFETKDGKIFRIQNSIIIPGAKILGAKLIPSSIIANVIGDEISDDYLIGPSYFTIPGFKGLPKYAGFYAKSTKPMKKIGNISLNKEELEKNKNELSNKLAQELKIDTLNSLKDTDLQLIKGASVVRIDGFNINDNVLTAKIVWQAIFFKEKDLRTLINYFVSSHFSDLKNFTFEDNISYPDASRTDFKKGELFFTFNIDKDNALPVNIDSLKKELVGRNENEMRKIVSGKTYINSAAISFWPFWVVRAPNNAEKINITIDKQ